MDWRYNFFVLDFVDDEPGLDFSELEVVESFLAIVGCLNIHVIYQVVF